MRKLALAIAAGVLVSVSVPAVGAPPVVLVKDNFFKPKRVTIGKGARVVWRWRGENPHNVALKKPGSSRVFKRSVIKTSGTYRPRFRAVGTWRVLCEVHPRDMRMRVIVRGG